MIASGFSAHALRRWIESALPIAKPLAVVGVVWLAWTVLHPLWASVGSSLSVAAHHFVGAREFAGFAGFHYLDQNWATSMVFFGDHVRYVVVATVISFAIALPLGVILARVGPLRLPVFVLLDAIYTVPSLVFFVILLRHTGLTDTTVVIVPVMYSQFILVRNVVVGIDGVPAEAKEAARGMGMNPMQILLRVELPLAMPVLLAGLRIAVVATVAIVALSATIAMPSLGSLFFEAVQNGGVNAQPQIEAAAVLVSVLALGADVLLRLVEHLLPANRVARAGGEPGTLGMVISRRRRSRRTLHRA